MMRATPSKGSNPHVSSPRQNPLLNFLTMTTMLSKSLVVAATVGELFPHLAQASIESPNILPRPPMGFNNWARFECDLNQTLFTETADSMVSTGLRDAGYNRLYLDDCWMTHQRADNGSLQWDTKKFPDGMPWLGQYFKERGFKFGIYEDSGNATCGGYPGSYGYEKLDAETFANWGVDYLKLDGCNVSPEDGRDLRDEYIHRYHLWHQILDNMAKPLIFSESAPAYFSGDKSLSDWYAVMDKMPLYGELARHSNDVINYNAEGNAWDSIMTNYNFHILVARYQKLGFYNDPDFLITDNTRLSADEKASQFALWASFSAPLIISAYIPALTKEELAILTNKDLLAVNQDPLVEQAALVSRDDTFDVLTKNLENGDRLLTVFNKGDSTATVEIPVERIGLAKRCAYKAKDLWDGSSIKVKDSVSIKLNTHATAVYRISLPKKCSGITPTGMVFNTASMNCLTSNDKSIDFAKCDAKDSQVWQFSPSGTASALSDTSKCLATDGKEVSLERCSGSESQRWSYSYMGDLKNSKSGKCLTEGLGVTECGENLESQVFGLPSGVHVHW